MDATKDPHRGVCGSCHNPHKQSETKEAFATCATAQCHARADTLTPFHRGLPEKALANCGSCHKAHVWKVPSTACVACHRDLDHPLRGAGAHPPVRASQDDASAGSEAPDPRPHGGPRVKDEDAYQAQEQTPAPAPPQDRDTTKFTHSRHKSVECTACHSSDQRHGMLTISQPAGCLGCHHSPRQKTACASCHGEAGTRRVTSNLTMSVWRAPKSRTLSFAHDRHAKFECKSCHNTPTTLAVGKSCASCHVDHHPATANCASCHPAVPVTAQAHHPRVDSHTGCSGSGCHTDGAVLALAPTRNVCVACHRDKTDHKPGGDCASCHLVGWSPNSTRGRP
jgi:hypothetical protein